MDESSIAPWVLTKNNLAVLEEFLIGFMKEGMKIDSQDFESNELLQSVLPGGVGLTQSGSQFIRQNGGVWILHKCQRERKDHALVISPVGFSIGQASGPVPNE